MYFDLENFGKKLYFFRKRLNLTQKDVSLSSGINVDTLRKIENGKVIPKQETLDLLSSVLKEDLNQVLLNYRLDHYSEFHKVKNRIERKLESGEFDTLDVEKTSLQKFLNSNINTYFLNQIKQLVLLIESVILRINDNDFSSSLLKLEDALKITTPDFSLSNYQNFVYNDMEIRILMNISLVLNKTISTEKSLELMVFCRDMAEPDEDLYQKICYNLSYTYHRLDVHEKALYYADLGINNSIQNRSLNYLNLLYFRKGIAEFLLKHSNYMDSLLKSTSFSELLGHDDLNSMLIDSCKKFYNINIPKSNI